MKNKIAYFLLLSLIIVAFIFWQQRPKPAPNTVFHTIKGEKIALKDLKGKPVLITFWATSCKSCIEEIPHLIDLYYQYHSQGLEIIATAMYYDIPKRVIEMSQFKKIPYPIALDLDSENEKAFGSIQFTPTTFLINSNGLIVFKTIGLFDVPSMKQRIENLLKP